MAVSLTISTADRDRNCTDLLIFKSFHCTVKCRFHGPPKETKTGSRNREVREVGGKIREKYIQGRQKLV